MRSHSEELTHTSSDEPSAEARATIRILIVDDDRTLREGCASVLQVEGYHVSVCGRGDEAVELVRRSHFDILIVDLFMTALPGIEIAKAVLAIRPNTIIIMATGNPSVMSNMEALRAGAWDYLPKPFSGTHLQLLVARAALSVLAIRQRNVAYEQLQEQNGNSNKLTILGVSAAFRNAVAMAHRVAPTNASVMIIGESGTGKELIAQLIHRHSRRAAKSLITINCAAMPEHLLESEMFGHRKGAFTGADRDKVGLLEAAHGGSFFLDELTEMPLPLQAKLLRVVQDGVLRRVGSEQHEAVDVRFISATNRDPGEAIRNRHLREDLFFRLNVFPIRLPPLRERVEDIPILAEHFLHLYWKRHRDPTEPMPRFNASALEFLRSRPWRGNVRDLQNSIEHLVVMSEPDTDLSADQVAMCQEDWTRSSDSHPAMTAAQLEAYHPAKGQMLAKFEKEYVRQLVARAAGNMSRAARMAAVDRTTLYRLLERHGYHRGSNEFPEP